MRLPDFFVIGAMKGGTSTLAAQLATQDGVFMSTPKEPNFFSDDAVFRQGLDWYSDLFQGASADDIVGEASTHYTKLPTYPQTIARLSQAVPEARFIYLMRDPVKRAISHYIHGWSQREITDGPDRAFRTHAELTDYGCYAMQIRPYVQTFGRENILLLRSEDLHQNPQGTLEKVGTFLGRPGMIWRSDMASENTASSRSRKLPLQHLLVDNAVATGLRRALVPKRLRTWVRERRTYRGKPEIPPDDLARMQEIFDQDAKDLAELFPQFGSDSAPGR